MTRLPDWLTIITLPMPSTLGQVHVYLIRGPSGTALIDTGFRDASSRKALDRQLSSAGLELSDIDTLLCTHHHADHAGLGRLFSDLGARTLLSAEDADSLRLFYEHPDLDRERATFHGQHEVPEGFIERVSPMFPYFRSLGTMFTPSELLQDGQSVDLAGIRFEVLRTPGHTRGHLCLYQPETGLVFTGDCVISDEVTHMSRRPEVQGTDPLGGFVHSLERLGRLDCRLALPGHGEVIEDLASRTKEILAHHEQRLAQVEEALGTTPRPAFDITEKVMGARPKAVAIWLALSQTLGYLEHLLHCGRAEEVIVEGKIRYRTTPD